MQPRLISSKILFSALISTLMLSKLTKAEKHKITTENLTHIINDTFYYPSILKLHNHLLYISYPKINSDVIIKLESKAISPDLNNSCSIMVSVPQERDVLITEAKILGNGLLIVGLVETSEAEVGPRLRFYTIDLERGCTHRDFSIGFDDEMLQYYKPFVLLPYFDTFDVFVQSRLYCRPPGSMCLVRLNTKGEQLSTRNFNFKTNDSSFDQIKLYPLREFEPDSGYVLVSIETSILLQLDADLRQTRRKRLPGYIRANSVLNSVIGVCHHVEPHGPLWSSTECAWLDGRFKTKARAYFTGMQAQLAVRIYGLADGGALMVEISRRGIEVKIKRLGSDGRISKMVEYDYDCNNYRAEPIDWFVELKGKIYCFSYMCRYSAITHCVKVDDVIELANFE